MLLNNPNRIRVFAKLPGDARNINFSIEGSRGVPLSSEDIKEGTKKMDFGDLLINSSTINTPDKLKDQKSMEEFTAHIIEVETFVEFCCLALRVPQP
jgi:hypothetical protein